MCKMCRVKVNVCIVCVVCVAVALFIYATRYQAIVDKNSVGQYVRMIAILSCAVLMLYTTVHADICPSVQQSLHCVSDNWDTVNCSMIDYGVKEVTVMINNHL